MSRSCSRNSDELVRDGGAGYRTGASAGSISIGFTLAPMTRDHHKWFSRSLNRDMELLAFGHAARDDRVPDLDGRVL